MPDPRWEETEPEVAVAPSFDDTEPLAEPAWDDTAPVTDKGLARAGREVSKGAQRSFAGTMDAMMGIRSFMADLVGNDAEAKKWRDAVARSKRLEQPWDGQTYDSPDVLAQDPEIYGGSLKENPSVARIAGSLAPTLIDTATALPFGPAGAAWLTMKETMPYYVEQRAKGVAPAKAMAAAMVYGVGTFLLEKTGLKGLKTATKTAKAGAKEAAKEFAKGTGTEAGTEGLQRAYQNYVELGFDGTMADYKQGLDAIRDPEAWKDLGGAVTEGAAEEALLGGLAGGAVKGGTMALAKGAQSAADRQQTIDLGPQTSAAVAPGAARAPALQTLVDKETNPKAKEYAEAYVSWVESGKQGKRPRWAISDLVAKRIRNQVETAQAQVEGEPAATVPAPSAKPEAGPASEAPAPAPDAPPPPRRLTNLLDGYTLPPEREYARQYWNWVDSGAKGRGPTSPLDLEDRAKIRRSVEYQYKNWKKHGDIAPAEPTPEATPEQVEAIRQRQADLDAARAKRTPTVKVEPPPAPEPLQEAETALARKWLAGPLDVAEGRRDQMAYPEGWNEERRTQLRQALARHTESKHIGAGEIELIRRAAWATDRPEMRRAVPAYTLPDGALVMRDGEWRMAKGDPDAETVQLKDGTTETLGPEQTTEASSVIRPGDPDYSAALAAYQKQEAGSKQAPAPKTALEDEVPWLGPKQLRNAAKELMLHGLSVGEVRDYLTGKTKVSELHRTTPREAAEDWHNLLAEIEIRRDAYEGRPIKKSEWDFYTDQPPPGYVSKGDRYVEAGSKQGEASESESAPAPAPREAAPPSTLDRAEAAIDQKLAEIKREGRVLATPIGVDPEVAALWIAKGAIKIARGVTDFARWSAEMLREFGDQIKPHLQSMWQIAQQQAKAMAAPASEGEAAPAPRNLANPGLDPALRDQIDTIRIAEDEAGMRDRRPEYEARSRGEARVAANPDNEWNRLLGGTWFDPRNGQEDMAAASTLLNRKGLEALRANTLDSLKDLTLAVVRYDETGGDIARALAIRHDMLATPEERAQRTITKALTKPSDMMRRQIQDALSAGNQKRVDELTTQAAKETQAALTELADMGYDPANLDPADLRDPATVAEIARTAQAKHKNFGDMVLEYWLNVGLLGSPKTIVQNLGGTYAHVMWTHTVDRMAQGLLNTVLRRPGAPDVRESVEALKIVAPGMHRAAWNAAKQAYQTEMPQLLLPGSKLDAPMTAIPAKYGGRIVRIPGRALRFGDEFAKRVAYELNMAELAYAQAKREGKTGDARIVRARQLAANPSVEMLTQSVREARTETFTGENGPIVQALAKLKTVPGWRYPVWAVLPFTSAPGQLIRTAARRSPLGSIRMLYRGLSAMAGKGAYAGHGEVFVKDLAEQLVGAAIMWLGFGLFRSDDNPEGLVTGSAKATPRPGERSMRLTAAPPNSVKLGDSWYSYAALDPAASQLQLWADTVDAIRMTNAGKGDVGAARAVEILKALVRDRTYMQGVAEIIRATESGDKGNAMAAQYAAGLAASFAPRIWRDAWGASDDYLRDLSVRTKDDRSAAYLKRMGQRSMPYSRLAPPPKRDLWGCPVQKGDVPGSDWVWRMVVPVRTQQAVTPTNIDRLIFNFNRVREDDRQIWPGLPGDTIEVAGVKREMTEQEYDAFLARRGQLALEYAGRFRLNFDHPAWLDMQRVQTAFDLANRKARAEYLSGKLSDTAYTAKIVADWREAHK